MDITLETASLDSLRTGVLVVGAFADGTLPSSARAIDEASKGKLSAVIKRGDLDAKAGSALMFHDLPGSFGLVVWVTNRTLPRYWPLTAVSSQ